jgi:hypothetical protein
VYHVLRLWFVEIALEMGQKQHDLCKLNECERLIGTFLYPMLQQILLYLDSLEGK